MKSLVGSWNNYWFRPAPLFNLAVVRIIVVFAQLILVLDYGRKIERALNLANLPVSLYDPPWVMSLLTWPFGSGYKPDQVMIMITTGILIGSGLLALSGLLTNVSLFVFTICNWFINAYNYSFHEFHHPEGIMMIALFVLALSPCGRLLSIDYIINWKRATGKTDRRSTLQDLEIKSSDALWPLLVIQWMFGLIYLSGAISKIYRSGLDWMNGYTLQFNLLDAGVRKTYPLGIWLGQQHNLAIIVSWISILFEGTFWLVPIFPRLAWIYLPAGIGIHLGIYFLMGPDFFEFIILYVVFIRWDLILKFVLTKFDPFHTGYSKPAPYLGETSPTNDS